MKILIICTGNTCRSQMAEAYLRSFDPELEVYSAGSNPEKHINPRTVKILEEDGIYIKDAAPKNAALFTNQAFDYVITVCDHAREHCPVFYGIIKNRLHIGFEDPAKAIGTEEEVMAVYRKVRDQIKEQFYQFYKQIKSK